jgi:hypothetical protein
MGLPKAKDRRPSIAGLRTVQGRALDQRLRGRSLRVHSSHETAPRRLNYSKDRQQAEWGSETIFAKQQMSRSNVRFGSEADIQACLSNVRFTPESGHSPA